MTGKSVDENVRRFIEAYIKTKRGEVTQQSDEAFTVKYPGEADPQTFTFVPSLAHEKKIPLIAAGSSMFQQILRECLEGGVLCQVSFSPKESYDAVLRSRFKDSSFACADCLKEGGVSVCIKPQPCHHIINNAKVQSTKITKEEPVKYLLFYYSVTFQNKLRPKNEETITILTDQEGNAISQDFNADTALNDKELNVTDYGVKLKASEFDELKRAADEKLNALLKQKVMLFDLPFRREKRSRIESFKKRLRRERREQVVSKKTDFDMLKWQASYEALLKQEEESFITRVTVRLSNLLVIHTSKVKFEVNLNNRSTIKSSLILGINQTWELTCPLCKKPFNEGYATEDGFYVCEGCVRQSIDTGRIYSKKAPLVLDETLNEYIERDAGFVCSVCGKRHSHLLEFKCTYDDSSICIHHYDLCDACGKVFSKLNLSYTDEFRRRLCPQHAAQEALKEP